MFGSLKPPASLGSGYSETNNGFRYLIAHALNSPIDSPHATHGQASVNQGVAIFAGSCTPVLDFSPGFQWSAWFGQIQVFMVDSGMFILVFLVLAMRLPLERIVEGRNSPTKTITREQWELRETVLFFSAVEGLECA